MLIGASLILVISGFFVLLNTYYSATEEKPVYGGTYTEGMVGQPVMINPLIANANDVDWDLTQIVFASLLDLIDNYKISNDNKTWNITLKKNLQWSDGQDLSVADVVFTLKTIQDPDTRSPSFQTWQGVTADGSLIELYLSERGTWTIVQTMGGVTCARADGVDWLLPPPPQAPEEETET